MSDELKALITLAEQDKLIWEVQRKLRGIPVQLADSRKRLDAEQVLLDEVKIPWEQWDGEIREKESTIEIAQETITRFEEHMKAVTTQHEYMAARKQIDEARRLNVRLQDEIVESRVKQEELEPQLKEVQTRYDKVLEDYQVVEAEILKVQSGLEADIAGYEQAKSEVAGKVDSQSLKYYERLASSGKFPALVPTVAGICSGCNIALPPQDYNQLIANPARYKTCSHCTRMIYYEPPAPSEEEQEEESRSA
ncbi:MAG: hypothetical protein IIA41_02400 [SAR324 cluster bacterium]|nr:hypothetical protein [SAR324 cluster bacterium]